MKTLVALSTVVVMFLMSCSSSQQFTEQDHQDYQELQNLVASKKLEIISNFANPLASVAFTRVANSNILGPGNNAANIDLTGNTNYLRIKGDTIQAFLPFFGERYSGGSYGGTNQGIEFNDLPEAYQVIPNDKKHAVDIKFKIDDEHQNSEHYNITITLFANNRSIIRVQSTNRSAIEYSGRVKVLTEESMASTR